MIKILRNIPCTSLLADRFLLKTEPKTIQCPEASLHYSETHLSYSSSPPRKRRIPSKTTVISPFRGSSDSVGM